MFNWAHVYGVQSRCEDIKREMASQRFADQAAEGTPLPKPHKPFYLTLAYVVLAWLTYFLIW